MDRTQWVVGGSLLFFVVVKFFLFCFDCQIGLRQEKNEKKKTCLKAGLPTTFCGWLAAKVLRNEFAGRSGWGWNQRKA